MKIRDLIEEVNYSLQNGERDVPSPTDPDEDWLEGTNARLPQVSQQSPWNLLGLLWPGRTHG